MLRVYLKREIRETGAGKIKEELLPEYRVFLDTTTQEYFLEWNGDLLDVTAPQPTREPSENLVSRVTSRTFIARFFRNDGQYEIGRSRITAQVVRMERTGAPVQQVSITGPSVSAVVSALSSFRTVGSHVAPHEDWGNGRIRDL